MKRRKGERVQVQEDQEEAHVVAPEKKKKKTKRKRGDTETAVSEVELPGEPDEAADAGSSEALERKKIKAKKKKKKRDTKSDEAVEAKATENASQSETESLGSTRGRRYTVSIALPGSIVNNAQTLELKTYLAGQVARAAVIFCVDEIVIFNERGKPDSGGQGSTSDPNVFLARLLEYQETPQYLRKALFPMHHDLKCAGLLNPLDCPHHMRAEDVCPYREGVVVTDTQETKGEETCSSLVNCGLKKNVVIDRELEGGTRVTVKFDTSKKKRGGGGGKMVRGEAVAPSVPRTVGGLYWGYTVRLADTFSAVFTDSPHKGGYDLTVGTSERGERIDAITSLPPFQHLLVVFGGLKGLEYSLECDDTLTVGDVSLLLHHYLNTCPAQGSRTIRTEEAIPISLAALRPLISLNTPHLSPSSS